MGSRAARAAWLIAPVLLAGLAHVAVLKAAVLQVLAIPLDGGARWRARPVLGGNKTWRGPVVMVVGTASATVLRSALWPAPHEYSGQHDAAKGAAMGLAYALAELPNSFVKRRCGVAPGEIGRLGLLQYVVDQMDSVAGCLLVARLLYRVPAGDLAMAFVLGTGVHIGVDRLMHGIGLKRSR